jgi:hypothetical protein
VQPEIHSTVNETEQRLSISFSSRPLRVVPTRHRETNGERERQTDRSSAMVTINGRLHVDERFQSALSEVEHYLSIENVARARARGSENRCSGMDKIRPCYLK